MSIIDFNAMKKWNKLPKITQKLILENVFCSKCGVTTIVGYTMEDDEYGVLIKGKCKKCGKNVARLLEDE